MKKMYLLIIALVTGIISFGQPQPDNMQIGLFDNGTHGSNPGLGANLVVAVRIMPAGGTYTAVPAANDLVMYLIAPKNPAFTGTETINIVQTNTTLLGASGTMQFDGAFDLGDPAYYYYSLTLNAAAGINLSSLTPGTWAFLFTISITPSKTPPQFRQVRIVDETNNAYLSGFIGSPTFTTLSIGGVNQLVPGAMTVLPVNLINFSGYKSGGKNVLNWTSANEQNNHGFEVQRSIDGTSYSAIGYVNSIAPGGNSVSEINYTFDDNSPVGKKQYYRLNQTDFDGRSKLSNIVMITRDKPTSLSIGGLFPNPASSLVNVIIDAAKRDKVTLIIVDVNGKTVKQQLTNVEIGSNTIPVEISNLAQGSYLVKVVCQADCETTVAKFNKQ